MLARDAEGSCGTDMEGCRWAAPLWLDNYAKTLDCVIDSVLSLLSCSRHFLSEIFEKEVFEDSI